MSTSLILLFATSWMLGFRHGIDWDHIAAVADIVSGQPRPGQEGKAFRLRSRWMLLINAVKKGLARFRPDQQSHPHTHLEHPVYLSSGASGCFVLGLIHGAGAETPTQVVLFATAAGAGGIVTGSSVLLAFVLGLLSCNSGMSLLVSLGFRQARHRVTFSLALGILTGVLSSVVGVLFLLGKSALLPALLGG